MKRGLRGLLVLAGVVILIGTSWADYIVIRVNLGGMFHCTKRVLKTMLRQRSGAIVNISSIVD